MGITITPYTFPFNIPQVRQALCDVFNRTAIVAAWGLNFLQSTPQPVPTYTIGSYQPDVRQFLTQCTYNPSYAASVLEKYGLTYRNGQWYLPNGTPLTIIGPSGFTDWMTITSTAAAELSAFGIPTKLMGEDVGVFYSVIFPKAEFEAAPTWLSLYVAYISAWAFLTSLPSWIPDFNVSQPWT